jgi:hypothetical protein
MTEEPHGDEAQGPPDAADLDALVEEILGRAPRQVAWTRVTAADAPAQWAALDAWVRWLVTRYALDHRDVPPCWYRHGCLVEELSALRGAHLVAFDPSQPASAPADWHTTFGNTRTRIRDWNARTGCKPGQHRVDIPADWALDPESCGHVTDLAAFTHADQRARQDAQNDTDAAGHPVPPR